jgi:membrane protein implicated in regulation of membrane protease activity
VLLPVSQVRYSQKMPYGANSEAQRLRAKAKTLTVWIWIIGAVGVFFAASRLSMIGRGAANPASGGTAYLAGYLIAGALFVIIPAVAAILVYRRRSRVLARARELDGMP